MSDGARAIAPTDGVERDELARVFRREAGRCTATLIRVLGDVDLAEDAVAEAFAIAASGGRRRGMPAEPRRLDHDDRPQPAIDRLRRESTRTIATSPPTGSAAPT